MAAARRNRRHIGSGLTAAALVLGLVAPAAASATESAADVARAIAAALHLAPSARLQILQDGATTMPSCKQPPKIEIGHGGTYRTATISCTRPAWRAYAELRISTPVTVAVARHALSPGARITAGDFVLRHLASTSIAGTPAAPGNIAGSQAAVPLAAGTPITVNDLTRPVAVRSGQTVTVHLQSGGVSVSFPAVVLENAAFGQKVMVENAQTHKRLTATLLAPGTPAPHTDTLFFRTPGTS